MERWNIILDIYIYILIASSVISIYDNNPSDKFWSKKLLD